MNLPAHASTLPYRRGVGLMLFNPQGLVFVGRRNDTVDAWQMPQGGIDEGETPVQAALRELEEEVGTAHAEILAESPEWRQYDLPPELVGKVWKGRYRGQVQKWFALRYAGRDCDIDIRTKHAEFSDWRWVRYDQLIELIVPFKRELYSAVIAEFATLARDLAVAAGERR